MTGLLQVRDLNVAAGPADDPRPIVVDLSFDVDAGAALGIVGESGSGKTTALRAVLGLLPTGLRITGGTVGFEGRDLGTASRRQLRAIRGRRIGVVWQDPSTSLDPVMRVGEQVAEVVLAHEQVSRPAAWARALDLMHRVDLPDVGQLARAYPHELSGGQRQRVVIAAAVAADPVLLLADEPTTALDVTVQQQVLDLVTELRRDLGLALLLISHDLAVVANSCERIAVMYAGRIVETGAAQQVLTRPRHPYTAGLLASVPDVDRVGQRPTGIVGSAPPEPSSDSCAFAARCPAADDLCRSTLPRLIDIGGAAVACHHPLPGAPA